MTSISWTASRTARWLRGSTSRHRGGARSPRPASSQEPRPVARHAGDVRSAAALCHDTAGDVRPSAPQPRGPPRRQARPARPAARRARARRVARPRRRRSCWPARSGSARAMRARLDRKPGDLVVPATRDQLDAPEPYVSRGGHKLAAALDAFGIDPAGATALDVGASTGGFTDVLLQRGARHVYALDVGRGQLAESLRRDPRVDSMERTNARTLTATTPARAGRPRGRSTCRSSRSTRSSAPSPATLAPAAATSSPSSSRSSRPGKGRTDHGVVRDPAIHREVLERVVAAARGARSRHARRHRVADPRPGGQSRVPRPPRAGPGCAEIGDRIAEVTADASTGRRMTVERIGFAYNPTIEAAVELARAGLGLVPGRAASTSGSAQAGDLERLRPRAADHRRARRPRWRRHVPARGAGGRRGRRPAARHQPRQGRLPLEGRGRRSREPSSSRSSPAEYRIDERMALEGRILRGGQRRRGRPHIALNDIVVARGSLARVCRLDVSIDDSHLATFIADGLVVASPTGSHRLLVLGRRPDPRPGQPQPRRDADRRLPVGDPVRRRQPASRSSAAGSSTRTRRSSRSTAARTCRSRSATSSRSRAVERPIRLVEPRAPSRSGTCSATRWSCCRRDGAR